MSPQHTAQSETTPPKSLLAVLADPTRRTSPYSFYFPGINAASHPQPNHASLPVLIKISTPRVTAVLRPTS